MRGINALTGKPLSGIQHLRQSIQDILATPVGTRVMRRDYGSRLNELIDAPLNDSTIIDIYAETAIALHKWEPRLRLTSVKITGTNTEGRVELEIVGKYLIDGTPIKFEGLAI